MVKERKNKVKLFFFSNLGMKRTDTQFLAIGHRVVPIIEMSHIFKCRLSMHVCALLITYWNCSQCQLFQTVLFSRKEKKTKRRHDYLYCKIVTVATKFCFVLHYQDITSLTSKSILKRQFITNSTGDRRSRPPGSSHKKWQFYFGLLPPLKIVMV